MANHVHVDAIDDAKSHVNYQPAGVVKDDGHSHEVFGVQKHLGSTTGEKGASNLINLLEHAGPRELQNIDNPQRKDFDKEALFTTNAPPLRSHLDEAKER